MKKFFSFVLCASAMLMANAQIIISPTGMMDEIGMQAEGMSPNMQYTAGSNQFTQRPTIWDVTSGEITEFGGTELVTFSVEPVYGKKMEKQPVFDDDWNVIDSVEVEVDDYANILRYDTIPLEEPYEDEYVGTFHAINNNGIAAGTWGLSYGHQLPAIANLSTKEVTPLYSEVGEEGGDAYAISEDGSFVVGFYFHGFDAKACYWTNNGQTRVDLPEPTKAEFGGPLDPAFEARWMSADASIILGWARDSLSGAQVMIHWTRNEDGTYTVHSDYAHQYFTAYDYDANKFTNEENPYKQFEPTAISADGNWIALLVMPKVDPFDWDAVDSLMGARLNLTTQELEILPYTDPAIEVFGIANNGTAVATSQLNFFDPQPRQSYVWFADSANATPLQDIFPTEEYFQAETADYITGCISADGTTIAGYSNLTDETESWVVTSFVATLPVTAIKDVKDAVKGVKMIENGHVVIIREGVRYNIMGQKF